MIRSMLSRADLERALSVRDLTDPTQGPHGIQLLIDALSEALAQAWQMAPQRRNDGRVVTIGDNYDELGYPSDAVARDARYTRYVDEQHMLRSHTSALIPPLLRAIETQRDVLYLCPGIVYRRDTIDRLHCGEPHQLDVWRLSRAAPLQQDDLSEMIRIVVSTCLPGAESRTEAAIHPYTTNGRQIDVRMSAAGPWIEIGECGLAHPAVLERAGLDARRWSGLAMGLGLDRLLMLRKGIPDIRLLRSTDPRVASQLQDLSPYRRVSDQPATTRDLSVIVDGETNAEELGDRVREALGPDAQLIEQVSVESETYYWGLPLAARARLQLRSDQKNLLVRVTIRHPTQTVSHEQGNRLRDRIYAAIHRGPVAESCSVQARTAIWPASSPTGEARQDVIASVNEVTRVPVGGILRGRMRG